MTQYSVQGGRRLLFSHDRSGQWTEVALLLLEECQVPRRVEVALRLADRGRLVVESRPHEDPHHPSR